MEGGQGPPLILVCLPLSPQPFPSPHSGAQWPLAEELCETGHVGDPNASPGPTAHHPSEKPQMLPKCHSVINRLAPRVGSPHPSPASAQTKIQSQLPLRPAEEAGI
jgi:hypothetical protein